MKHFLANLLLSLVFIAGFAQNQEVPYTLEDRDHLIRVESRMDVIEAKTEALEMKQTLKSHRLM
jgi:hypothetical protein